ncbi:cytochrome P450 71AU50-like [Solanum stenotomum]|uniref:cytochrome P450 71AU50-like n=1 Tax=Solanum stenotomum TaxID=172797 RepID=UPI0020D1E320|nr:cytochrome P450 71AU50-like [Solanum stenotomum]
MVFGKKYMEEEFDERGFIARLKDLAKIFDEFFEKVIDDHVQLKEKNQAKDMVDTMMTIMQSGEAEFKFDRRDVKVVLLDLLIGSTDTVSTAIEWIVSELLRHPKVIKKLQNELEQAVDMNRMVEESDFERLEYLGMVIKEGLRLHPPSPLLPPHESIEDCIVDGFDIPKGSRLYVNAWAIGRDPKAWSEPEKFMPERFVDSNIDLHRRDFQLLPFGSGRRSCSALQLGLTIVRLVIAQLVHCFDSV